MNGLVWGGVVGLFAFVIYRSIPLSLVMMLAMVLNLILAAISGVLIPLTLHRFGRDPAAGSSVMITAVTDSGGFFIFLGLATLFLLSRGFDPIGRFTRPTMPWGEPFLQPLTVPWFPVYE